MDKNTSKGLAAVKRLVEEHKIQGVHGPLLELFECDEKFNICLETLAGAK